MSSSCDEFEDQDTNELISDECEKLGLDEEIVYSAISTFTESDDNFTIRKLALGIADEDEEDEFCMENPYIYCDIVILNHIISTSKSECAQTVFRGISPPDTELALADYNNFKRSIQKNKMGTFDAITSTSYHEKIVRDDFASEKGSILFIIEIPAENASLYLGEISDAPLETEVLLPAGTKYKITNVRDRSKDLMIVEITVVSSRSKKFGKLTLKSAISLREKFDNEAMSDIEKYTEKSLKFSQKTKKMFFKNT